MPQKLSPSGCSPTSPAESHPSSARYWARTFRDSDMTCNIAASMRGLWFPVSCGAEFRLYVLFLINLEITISVENSAFKRTKGESRILDSPPHPLIQLTQSTPCVISLWTASRRGIYIRTEGILGLQSCLSTPSNREVQTCVVSWLLLY